jgi:hypothetical protein
MKKSVFMGEARLGTYRLIVYYGEEKMRKIIVSTILLTLTISAYSQDVSQIIINNTRFEIGTNNYQNDYDLIYNNWYKGHLSAETLVVGEDVSWVNSFTRNINLGEPSEAKLRLFEIELGEVRVLIIGSCGLYYNKDTNKLIAFSLNLERMINNQTVETILNFFQPYYRTYRPQTISMNEKYDVSNGTKNIVSEYLIYSYLHFQGYLFGGADIYSVSVSPDIYKRISDLKQWHRQAQREIPRSYFFTVYDKLTLSQIEENKRAIELAEQRERERLRIAEEERVARERAELEKQERRAEWERQEAERIAQEQRQRELREQERLAQVERQQERERIAQEQRQNELREREARDNAIRTKQMQLIADIFQIQMNNSGFDRTASDGWNRQLFQRFIELYRLYQELRDYNLNNRVSRRNEDDFTINAQMENISSFVGRSLRDFSNRQRRDFEREFGRQ